jgi:hypothetical protein
MTRGPPSSARRHPTQQVTISRPFKTLRPQWVLAAQKLMLTRTRRQRRRIHHQFIQHSKMLSRPRRTQGPQGYRPPPPCSSHLRRIRSPRYGIRLCMRGTAALDFTGAEPTRTGLAKTNSFVAQVIPELRTTSRNGCSSNCCQTSGQNSCSTASATRLHTGSSS